jgi:FkbM family methyltransferase
MVSVGRMIFGPSAFEEVEIVRRAIPRGSGVMIDVGAHVGSTALPFARDGWQVHAFEPDSSNRARLLVALSGLDNVKVVPAAVSNTIGSLVLYRSDLSSGISSLSPFHESHREGEAVDVTTLAAYVEEQDLKSIDFLKVDTEGYDFFVLQGVPWERLKPGAIVCEFEDRKTLPLGYSYHDIAQFLVAKGYFVLVSEWQPVREYGSRHQWRHVKPYPHELADVSAWGNLIAVPPELQRELIRSTSTAAMRLRLRLMIDRLKRTRGGRSQRGTL